MKLYEYFIINVLKIIIYELINTSNKSYYESVFRLAL